MTPNCRSGGKEEKASARKPAALMMVAKTIAPPETRSASASASFSGVEAQAAVKIDPGHPPNQLALGEALKKNSRDPRAAYAEALRLAEGSSDPDAAGWASDAREALR